MAATPAIPNTTSAATTIRMTFAVLLPPVGGAGVVAGVGVAPATAVPHWLQIFVSGERAAPQELQNAIDQLNAGGEGRRREYIADGMSGGVLKAPRNGL